VSYRINQLHTSATVLTDKVRQMTLTYVASQVRLANLVQLTTTPATKWGSKSKYPTEVHGKEMKPVSNTEDKGSYVPPKHWYLSTKSHGVTSQNAAIFFKYVLHLKLFPNIFLYSVLNCKKLCLCHKKKGNCFETVKSDKMFVLCKPNDASVQLSESFSV
jgi:hypothetical protein